MSKQVTIIISSCTKCVHFDTERVYTADYFEHIQKWFCKKKEGLVIDSCHDTFDKDPGIPDGCPLDNSEIKIEKAVMKPEEICELICEHNLIGADGIAKAEGYELRIVEQDGVTFMGTCDFRIDRINIIINNGLITSATIG